MAKGGYRIGDSSYAEWESGRKRPSRDAMPHLIALFGEPDPEPVAPAVPADGGTDIARLAAAIEAQTAAINALVAKVGDPAETAAVVAQVVVSLLQARGVLEASPGRSGSAALPQGQG